MSRVVSGAMRKIPDDGRGGWVRRLWLALLLVSTVAPAQEAERLGEELLASGHVEIRARVEPAVVYVGQKTELIVDVLTKTWFLQAPRYPGALALEDAIVLPAEGFGVNFTERRGGESFAGQTRRITIFPARPGSYEVPSIAVTLAVADERSQRTPDFTLRTPPVRFEARLPPGVSETMRGGGLVVATPELEASQGWEPEPVDLEVGDAVRRTVRLVVRDAPAMLLPAPDLAAPEGVEMYAERPTFEDRRQRGTMTGVRLDRATFVFAREGVFELPAVEVRWWDLEADRLRIERLPGFEATVAPAAEVGVAPFAASAEAEDEGLPEESPSVSAGALRRRLFLLLLALLVAVASVLLSRRFRWWAQRRRGRNGDRRNEATAFTALRRTARSGDALATLAALYAWLDGALPEAAPRVEQLLDRVDDPRLRLEVEALTAAAIAGRTKDGWRPRGLVAALRRARSCLVSGPPESRRLPVAGLGPLNPT